MSVKNLTNISSYQTSSNLLADFELLLQERIVELNRDVERAHNANVKKRLQELLYLNTYLYKFLFVGLH